MSNDDVKELNKLREKETRRKQQVKEYFIRRNAKNLFYKTFFEKNAKEADRKALQEMIKNL